MRRIVACLVACALASSCALTEEHWSFMATREACASGYWSFARPVADASVPTSPARPEAAAAFLAVILLLPPVLDLAILPVTGVHDLFFLD